MAQEIRYWLQEAIKKDPVLSHREFENFIYTPFEILNLLEAEEKQYNSKGELNYKNYYYCFIDDNGVAQKQLAVKIRYSKIVEDKEYNGVVIPSVFAKTQKHFDFYRTDGLVHTKSIQPLAFKLKPVFIGDGTETLKDFSSKHKEDILFNERESADSVLRSENPTIYKFIRLSYKEIYENYLLFGDKTELEYAFDNETRTEVLSILNHIVAETDNFKVVDLIKMNLQ